MTTLDQWEMISLPFDKYSPSHKQTILSLPGEIYTDSTGTDLTQFIINTLNKNSKDRVLMLKLEQEMTNLVNISLHPNLFPWQLIFTQVKDGKKTHHKFPHMSSYHRMVVHRWEQ